jgi:isopentenyl diphosphate isomerase/L-lactate dehydrogenase-like FMN-dependent dehydrogenase
VDNAVASLDALVRIREEVGPEPTLLLDSGVRTGADVYVARALGADAVLLGRTPIYGLAVAGQRGVEEVLRNVVAELDLTMALAGTPDLASITRDDLVREGG